MMAPFPIRLQAVTVDAFRGWSGRHRLVLDAGLTLLVGSNGAGKSSLVNAVEWCLFGAQVARKSSGLDERAEWEIMHRESERGVEVGLELELPEGLATLVRRREPGAKLRDPDLLRLELPGGDVIEDSALDEWLASSGLPDWQTWKHAFCQHQEQPRSRVMNSAERSVQLGRLLGLDAYRATGERLKGLKFLELAARARSELDSIEDELTRCLERPDRELRELEERIERRGVARTEISGSMLLARTEALVLEGRRIADRLDLDAALPDPSLSTLPEVLRWAHDWAPLIQTHRRRLERERGELAGELRELDTALSGIEPAKRRRHDARAAWKRWTAEYGTQEALEREVQALRGERERLRAAQREHDERLQLVRQAVELLDEAKHDDACPVCGHASSELLEKLRQRLAEAGPGAADRELDERTQELRERARRLEQQRAELASLESDLELADTEYARIQRRLEARLSEGGLVSDADGVRNTWREQVASQQVLVDEVDEHLVQHRSDIELLELLSRWQAARARADLATGDLTRIEAWSELQEAIDDASRLAVDLDVLGQLARQTQEERSEERVREVNRTLGAHYGRITGQPQDASVRVQVKATAARLTYRLVDAQGESITPVLNQAALNALSMAVLFAQAEERARRELPQWLLLDDPGQSLDERCAEGLARALVEIAPRIPTLVATFPGVLADALSKSGQAGRILRIATDATGRGVGIEEVRA